ncbi:MAG: HAMP domain-containing histidine kinase [Thermoleophilia bacterium]|nr:HAMP domain-containing histidine kinase [Thermoleophilia bacterium]
MAMTIVLGVMSLWIYERQDDGYQRAVHGKLTDRLNDLADVKLDVSASAEVRARQLVAGDTGAIQVYDRGGRLLASSVVLRGAHVVSPARAAAASIVRQRFRTHTSIKSHRDVEVLVTRAANSDLVVANVESEVSSHEALERLAVQLLFGAVVAVLLGSLLAFSLARAALRPVELLRTEAQRYGRGGDDVVLEVPPTRDEIARLAATLNELLGRMHEATVHERQFVAEAGHELRTPIATVLAELELSLEVDDQDPAHAATLRSLHEEVSHLATLADQLLRLSTGGRVDAVETLEVGAITTWRVDRARTQHDSCTFDMSDAPDAFVEADPNRIAQALDNLLDNAVVHGGHHVQVRIEQDDQRVEVHVLDDGVGITPADAARAFERFSRSDEARSRRGSGLGLAIVQSIVLSYGGDCGIHPRTDGQAGTDAWISLPLRPASAG